MARGKRTTQLSKRGRGGRGGRAGSTAYRTVRQSGKTPQHASGSRGFGLGFTLVDEARQTSQHDESFWSTKLRNRPVVFLSAGAVEPMKQLESLLQQGEDDGGSACNANTEKKDEEKNAFGKASFILANEREETVRPRSALDEEEPTFFFDVDGDKSFSNANRDFVHLPDRSVIAQSSSDDEVILFKGRNTSKRSETKSKDLTMIQLQTEIQVVEDGIKLPGQEQRESRRDLFRDAKMTHHRAKFLRKQEHRAEAEDALIADYIANMQESGEYDSFAQTHAYRQRDLGGSSGEVFVEDDSGHSSLQSPIRLANDRKTDDEESGEASKEKSHRADRESQDDAKQDCSESDGELDDETLARLIAGQEFDGKPEVNPLEESSSDSSEDDKESKAFDSDDLMNWNRPSLQSKKMKKGKAAKASIGFDVSDSELEQALRTAWKNDRMKKSQRKREREEQRALGLLGKNVDPDDPMVKYSMGMTLDEVTEELKRFLQNKDDMLTLPPMDRQARKVIHELANKFNIKSKSTGKGGQRRPTLYRTARTIPLVESTFDRAVSRITRPYFPRMDVRDKRPPKADKGQSSYAQASYQDGEIVGAAAPELGVENRGRNMLEKMGWSQGTALGAMDNKGILQPVLHTMKRTKAGLG